MYPLRFFKSYLYLNFIFKIGDLIGFKFFLCFVKLYFAADALLGLGTVGKADVKLVFENVVGNRGMINIICIPLNRDGNAAIHRGIERRTRQNLPFIVKMRPMSAPKLKTVLITDKASDEFKAAAQAYLDTKEDGAANKTANKALIEELEKAAEAGYRQTFRYNPTLEANKLTIDSKEPTGDYVDFIKNETRYARLAQSNPERAAALFAKAEANAKAKYDRLVKMGKLYE